MKKLTHTLAVSAAALALALALPTLASAECPKRGDISSLIEEGVTVDEINEAFGEECAVKSASVDGKIEKDQQTEPTGSVFWEAIDSCGYHPQRRELECSVEVRQRFGFGGVPGGGPGSWEWLQFCVDYGAGMVPVNVSAVHVHDEPFGVQPPWYYGISVQANERLHQAAVNGQTLKARAILSWTFVPTGCNFIPVWGSQSDFKIKLDP